MVMIFILEGWLHLKMVHKVEQPGDEERHMQTERQVDGAQMARINS